MIILENIKKKFGNHTVIDRFSLTISDGMHLAIMGESGKGKTTLLRIIAGLESVDDGNVSGYSLEDISYAFQESRLFDSLTVLKNLTVVSALPKKEAVSRASSLLCRVGLSESAKKRPRQLSGGMRQRLSLARTFMIDKPIILLDEPFSALDPDTKDLMISFVKEETRGKTLIMITHDLGDAEKLCDTLIRL